MPVHQCYQQQHVWTQPHSSLAPRASGEGGRLPWVSEQMLAAAGSCGRPSTTCILLTDSSSSERRNLMLCHHPVALLLAALAALPCPMPHTRTNNSLNSRILRARHAYGCRTPPARWKPRCSRFPPSCCCRCVCVCAGGWLQHAGHNPVFLGGGVPIRHRGQQCSVCQAQEVGGMLCGSSSNCGTP